VLAVLLVVVGPTTTNHYLRVDHIGVAVVLCQRLQRLSYTKDEFRESDHHTLLKGKNVLLLLIHFSSKVCKSVHHHTFKINQPTKCIHFSSILLDVYVQLSMFRASSHPSSEAQQLQ
jgi:hypothetical protein